MSGYREHVPRHLTPLLDQMEAVTADAPADTAKQAGRYRVVTYITGAITALCLLLIVGGDVLAILGVVFGSLLLVIWLVFLPMDDVESDRVFSSRFHQVPATFRDRRAVS